MSDCPFCRIGQGEIDDDLVAYRTKNAFVIPTLMQRENNPGHTLVLPVSHVSSLHEAPRDLLHEVFDVVARVTTAVKHAYRAVGSTIVQNNEAPGQVIHHLHVSVIPRFGGDRFRVPDPELCEAPRDVRLVRAAALRRALELEV
ncbi:HIT family protein [Streptomyces sp. RB6PN25]|uniref:HIT family protein n=1 Tax=Streptomyces humicola TaxID=2953240 RepID=A0ABT1PSW5_9ACTN|nr:HIT family protein [Streptomyces humicola]MCQ4080762.1 HIT family protein [Streptomyces humicola]